MKRMKLLFTLALPVLLYQNAQAQTSSRLIARADWHNDGAVFQPTDTAVYMYSNGRGGDLTSKMMKFDSSRFSIYDVVAASFVNSSNTIQDYNSDNSIYHQIYQSWNNILLSWNNLTQNIYFYSGGNVSTVVHESWNSSTSHWDNTSEDVYSYDPSNRLTQDVYKIWNSLTATFSASAEWTYFYDGAGNLIQRNYLSIAGSTYTPISQESYTYDGSNRMTSMTYNQWDGAQYVPSYMYAYTYDAAGDRLTEQYSTYNMTTSAWDNVTLKTYSGFTGAMMPTTETDQTWDTTGGGMWMNDHQYTYEYNGSNQLTRSTGISWNPAGFWQFANGDLMSNYYYETYTTNPTAVNNVTADGAVNIFPNPAQDMININMKWNEAQSGTISVFDMTGRVVRQWNVPATTQYSTMLSVNNFPAGNYIVKINGTMGQMTQQIVVAH